VILHRRDACFGVVEWPTLTIVLGLRLLTDSKKERDIAKTEQRRLHHASLASRFERTETEEKEVLVTV
jgi:hypothetical protein